MKPLIRKETKTVEQVEEVMEPLKGGDIILMGSGELCVVHNIQHNQKLLFSYLKDGIQFEHSYDSVKNLKPMHILTREEALAALAKMWGLPEPVELNQNARLLCIRSILNDVGIGAENAENAVRLAAETITRLQNENDTLRKDESIFNKAMEVIRKHLESVGMTGVTVGYLAEQASNIITALRAKVEQLEHDESLSDESIGLLRGHLQAVGIEAPFLDDVGRIAGDTIAALRKQVEELKEQANLAKKHLQSIGINATYVCDSASIAAKRIIDAVAYIDKLKVEVQELQAAKTVRLCDVLNDLYSAPSLPPAKFTEPAAPAIRRFKLVNAKWLEEWQKSGKATAGQNQLAKSDYEILNGDFLTFPGPLSGSCCPVPDFLALVDRGIYVEMTPGRVVYQKGEEFWTTDAAGDCRWLNLQYAGHSGSIAKSGYSERRMIDIGFTKIIG